MWRLAVIAIVVSFLASIGIVWLGGANQDSVGIPHLLSYQGVLADHLGDPVPDGTYQMTFSIYENATGGSALWSETRTVQVTDGRFSILLGSVTPIPSDVFLNGSERWLGVQVESDAEMTPRQRLASVAYAYVAEYTRNPLAPGQDLVITDADGNVTHRLNANGTSWHDGLATFNNGLEFTYVHSPPGMRVEEGVDEDGCYGRHYDENGIKRYEVLSHDGQPGAIISFIKRWYNENGILVREYYEDEYGEKFARWYNETGILVREYYEDKYGKKVVKNPFTVTRMESVDGCSSQTGTHTCEANGSNRTVEISSDGMRMHDEDGNQTVHFNSQYGSLWMNGIGHFAGDYYYFDGITYFIEDVFVEENLTVVGTKNAVVSTRSYGNRTTYCDESAEVYFFDRGEAHLDGGVVTVELDPIFLETVTIDDTHPMLIQLTPTAECNGLYVAQRTTSNFTVQELQGGRSDAGFMWEVAAKRTGYEDTRLAEVD